MLKKAKVNPGKHGPQQDAKRTAGSNQHAAQRNAKKQKVSLLYHAIGTFHVLNWSESDVVVRQTLFPHRVGRLVGIWLRHVQDLNRVACVAARISVWKKIAPNAAVMDFGNVSTTHCVQGLSSLAGTLSVCSKCVLMTRFIFSVSHVSVTFPSVMMSAKLSARISSGWIM